MSSEPFYYHLRAMERSLPQLTGIRSRLIKAYKVCTQQTIYIVGFSIRWTMWQTVITHTAIESRSVSTMCRRKTKLLAKLNLAGVCTMWTFNKKSHLSPLVINHLFWINAWWILTLFIIGECRPIPIVSQSYDFTSR